MGNHSSAQEGCSKEFIWYSNTNAELITLPWDGEVLNLLMFLKEGEFKLFEIFNWIQEYIKFLIS